MRRASLPAGLTLAIANVVTTAEHFDALRAEWLRVLTENAARDERIRAQIARGFIRSAEGQYPHTSPHKPPDAKRHRAADHTLAANGLMDARPYRSPHGASR